MAPLECQAPRFEAVLDLKTAFLASGNSFTDAPLCPERVTASLPVSDYPEKN
jgi:hypothetical protein